MFDVWCPACDRYVLLGSRRVVAIDRAADGVVARLRCYCGRLVDSCGPPA